MRIYRVMLPAALLLASIVVLEANHVTAAPQSSFTVNTIVDAPDAQPGNGTCETAIGNGVCPLRAAIMEANALPGADIIQLPAGFHELNRVGSDDTALNGDLDVIDTLSIYGKGASSTTISGNGAVTQNRVFHILSGGTLTIYDVAIIRGVSPGWGGGVYNLGELTLTNSIVTGNVALDHGGGIYNHGVLKLTNSSVSGNFTNGSGGGIYADGGATTTLTNSTVSGNRAKFSGGGINHLGGTLSLTNATVSGNRADTSGGGLRVFVAYVYLYNVTLVSNVADDNNDDAYAGGGIDNNDSDINVVNTIIANNVQRIAQSPFPLPDDCKGLLFSYDFNLIENLTGCTVIGATTHNLTGQDPQLGQLQTNGGYTQTHALNANSPAIDAGNSAGCWGQLVTLTTDQRGAPRHLDGDGNGSVICDMGAFEYQVLTPTATPTPTKTPNGCAAKPAKPTLNKPANGKTLSTTQVTLKWYDVACETHYKAVVKNAATNMKVFKANLAADVTKVKTSALAMSITYKWFVKACNTFGCSKSAARQFTLTP